MNNSSFLSCTDHDRIYPGLGDLEFDVARDQALRSSGCIPLLWLALYSENDLRTATLRVPPSDTPTILLSEQPNGQVSSAELDFPPGESSTTTATAPLVERELGLVRLKAREAFFEDLFADNGGLANHFLLFREHLARYGKRYLALDCQEVSWLYAEKGFEELLLAALSGLDRLDPACKIPLVTLSTVLDRPFVPAAILDPDSHEPEDRFNLFRLLGENVSTGTPWDQGAGAESMRLGAVFDQRSDGVFVTFSLGDPGDAFCFEEGDELTGFEGKPVDHLLDLNWRLLDRKAGERVRLKLRRGGQFLEAESLLRD